MSLVSTNIADARGLEELYGKYARASGVAQNAGRTSVSAEDFEPAQPAQPAQLARLARLFAPHQRLLQPTYPRFMQGVENAFWNFPNAMNDAMSQMWNVNKANQQASLESRRLGILAQALLG